MATRYDRITIEGAVEFAGPFATVVEPTPVRCEDPRFVAFMEMLAEWRLEDIKAAMVARGPDGVVLL